MANIKKIFGWIQLAFLVFILLFCIIPGFTLIVNPSTQIESILGSVFFLSFVLSIVLILQAILNILDKK